MNGKLQLSSQHACLAMTRINLFSPSLNEVSHTIVHLKTELRDRWEISGHRVRALLALFPLHVRPFPGRSVIIYRKRGDYVKTNNKIQFITEMTPTL